MSCVYGPGGYGNYWYSLYWQQPVPQFTPSWTSPRQPPEDPYEIDGSGPSESPITPSWAATDVAFNPGGVPPGNDRIVSFVNDGDKPMHLRFTPNAGEQEMPDIVIPPGEAVNVQFPPGWSGNVRSTSGGFGNPATLIELAFDDNGKAWGDVSFIEGANAAATIEPAGGGTRTGFMTNLLEGAPDSLVVRDANGVPYAIRPSTVNNVIDPYVLDFLEGRVPEGHGYKYPTDDLSTVGFESSNLVVHVRDFI